MDDDKALVPELVTEKPPAKVGPTRARQLELVKRCDDRVRRKNQRILDWVHDAPMVDPAGPKPEGWSDAHFRVAAHAQLPDKLMPGYLKIAARVFESYRRSEADQKPVPTLGAEIKVFVQEAHIYPRRDVTDRGGDR